MFKTLHIFGVLVLLFFNVHIQVISGNENLLVTDQKNVYYIESEQKFTWFDALAQCAKMNMSLATIDTKSKSDDLTTLLKNAFGKRIPLWMGGCVNGVNPRQFVWIATGKKFLYTNWAPGQPDFAGNNEYCAQTGWIDNMQWNDHVCNLPFGFICEPNPQQKCEDGIIELGKRTENERVELSQLLKYFDGSRTFRDIVFNINQK